MDEKDKILGNLTTLLLRPERVGSYGMRWFSLIAREGPIILVQESRYGDPSEDRSLSTYYYIRDMSKPAGERTILTFRNPADFEDVAYHFNRRVEASWSGIEREGPWKCYYCESVFRTRREVLDHLGWNSEALPNCCKDRV